MSKQLLILDVDETLVFADEKPLSRLADFQVGPYHVYRRPFLREFINATARWFDLAVWSSATSTYVHDIVRAVFGESDKLRFVWTRDRCTQRYDAELQEHYYAKNLSKLRTLGFDLEHILMIDDSPRMLSQHYGNYIRVIPFTGDEADTELQCLLPFLESIHTVDNVRRIEKRFWRQFQPAK